MDRNSIIGLLLIGLILVSYSIWMAPSQEEIEARKREQDSLEMVMQAEKKSTQKQIESVPATAPVQSSDDFAIVDTTLNADSIANVQMQDRFGIFAANATGEETYTRLENENVIVTLCNKGGRIKNVELKKYKTFDFIKQDNHYLQNI